MAKTLGITGGIGGGKSYVSTLLQQQFGIPVYDCDAEAKRLTATNEEIRQKLIALVGPEVFENGELNKPLLAEYLFADVENASQVNAIIHPVVLEDFVKWSSAKGNQELVGLESDMERFERELDDQENRILSEADPDCMNTVNRIRGDVRDLRVHYAQLIDFSQELEENENGFFSDENIRYFHMFTSRVERLYNIAAYLRDYTEQLGDIYHLQLEAKQNRIMTVLTIVSTIFMPLTLITGWFGMNFRYMPELESPWAYPIVIVISVVIIVASLIYFRKKKLL